MPEKLCLKRKNTYKNTGPLSDKRRPAFNPALHTPEFFDFLLTRWLRNILFVMFYQESVAVE